MVETPNQQIEQNAPGKPESTRLVKPGIKSVTSVARLLDFS